MKRCRGTAAAAAISIFNQSDPCVCDWRRTAHMAVQLMGKLNNWLTYWLANYTVNSGSWWAHRPGCSLSVPGLAERRARTHFGTRQSSMWLFVLPCFSNTINGTPGLDWVSVCVVMHMQTDHSHHLTAECEPPCCWSLWLSLWYVAITPVACGQ